MTDPRPEYVVSSLDEEPLDLPPQPRGWEEQVLDQLRAANHLMERMLVDHVSAGTATEAAMLANTRRAIDTLERIVGPVAAEDAPAAAADAKPCFVVRFVRLRPTRPGELRLPLWETTGVAYPTLDDALAGAADHTRLNLSPHAVVSVYPLADGTGAMADATIPGWPAPLAVFKVEPTFVVVPAPPVPA